MKVAHQGGSTSCTGHAVPQTSPPQKVATRRDRHVAIGPIGGLEAMTGIPRRRSTGGQAQAHLGCGARDDTTIVGILSGLQMVTLKFVTPDKRCRPPASPS
jgi:hypothetical protein